MRRKATDEQREMKSEREMAVEEIDQLCRVQTLPSNADPWLSWSSAACQFSSDGQDEAYLRPVHQPTPRGSRLLRIRQ